MGYPLFVSFKTSTSVSILRHSEYIICCAVCICLNIVCIGVVFVVLYVCGGFNVLPLTTTDVPSKYMLLTGTRNHCTIYSGVPDNTICSATRYSVLCINSKEVQLTLCHSLPKPE